MDLSHLKFRTRLILIFGISFMLFVGAIYFSVQKLNKSKKILTQLYNYSLTNSNAVNDIYNEVVNTHHETEKLIQINNSEFYESSIQSIKGRDINVHNNFLILFNHFSGEREFIEKSYKIFINWQVTRHEIIQLLSEGKKGEALALYKEKCHMQSMTLFDSLKVLGDFSKNWADKRYLNNLDDVEKSKKELLLVLLIILVIGNIMAFIVSQSISKPIKKLIKRIETNHHFNKKIRKSSIKKSEQELLEFSVNELDKLSIELEDFNKKLKLKVAEKTEDLQKSEQRYELAVGASHMGIWDWDIERNTVYYSNVWKQQLGYKNNELQNTRATFRNLVHPKQRKNVLESIGNFVKKPKGQWVYDFKMKHKSGDYIWIQSTAKAQLNKQGKTVRLFGMHRDITKYVMHEKQLQKQYKQIQLAKEKAVESKLRIEKAQEVAKMGFLDWDLETNKIYLSKQVVALFEFPKNTKFMLPEMIEKLILKEELEKVQTSLNNAISGKGKHNIDHRIVTRNGKVIWVQTQADLLFDASGKPITLLGTVVDITARKEAEFNLKRSEEFNNAILQSALSAIISIDDEGNVITWNKAADSIFNYNQSEIISQKFYNILASKYSYINKYGKPQLKNEIRDLIVENTAELIGIKKNGEAFPIEISLSKWDNNGQLCYTGIIRDITERKDSEKQNKKLLTAVEQSTNAIMVSDTNAIIEYVNPAFETLTGYSFEEVLGKTPALLKSGKQSKAFYKEIWETILSGESWKGNFINKAKDGHLFWDETSITPLKNNQGEITNFLAIKQDVTERVNSRKELKKQNKALKKAKAKAEASDLLKTEFLHNMSHEIRTPMNGILGFSDLLSKPELSEEKRLNFVKIIQNSGKQLLQVIDDILEISELDTKHVQAKKKPVCLNDMLLELFSIFDGKAKENKVSLYLKTPLSDSDSTILTDRLKLYKILSNLLENAFKFTRKGYIDLGYTLVNHKDIHIYVKDTGIGIDPEKHQLIFERFSQGEFELSKKVGGLGLGLSIAKENAKLLGGELLLESTPLKGSTFTVILPYKKLNQETVENEEITVLENNNVSEKNNTACTFLIAEDEEVNYLFLEILLKDQLQSNCNILHAKNGAEAVEMFKSTSNIKLVLMDIKMPKMNGYEATQKIKELNPNIPVIAQTAYSTKEDKRKALNAGCDDFLSKPIKKEALQQVLTTYIAR